MRRLRALVAVVLAVALVGCTDIPTAGPVVRVSAAPGRVNSGVEIAPAAPVRGATAVEVIEGFLHAMAAVEPDYRIARTYLVGPARDTWNPNGGVRIYAEGAPPIVTDQGARLSAPLVGVVDAQGGFAESGGRLDHDFGLVRDADGQWRVSTPPDGIVLSEYLFRSTFVRVPVYFKAAGQRWLVPDSRYFVRGRRAFEQAVRAVVNGPTSWAAPIVDHPARGLRVQRVELTPSGVAEVALASEGGTSPEQRAAVAAQLAWTLRGFDSVVAVRLLGSDGAEWAVPGFEGRAVPVSGAVPDADPQAGTTSRQLFGVVGGQVVRVNEGNSGIETIPLVPAVRGGTSLAVRHDVQEVAVVREGQVVVTGTALPEGLSPGHLVRRPHYSRLGELWVPDATNGVLLVVDGKPTPVAAEGLPAGQVVGLRVSPDAARIALVVKRADGRRILGMAGIARSAGGSRILGWRQVAIHGVSNDPLDVLDVGWRTPDALMLLVADGRGTTVLSVHPDGSAPVVVGPPGASDLVELAVAVGVTPVVRSSDGHLYRYYADYRWTYFAADVEAVAYAG